MHAISIKNLKKYFGKVKAVDDISFDVEQKDVFGFLGPNGAGKTTTIRLIQDFINKDEGQIKVFGKDAHEYSAKVQKEIGYISSEDTLYENWNGYDHIRLFENVYGKSDNLDDLMSTFDFDPSRKILDLSTGNKRKLLIILALMHKPKLLIADEPTTGLDPLLQNRFYELIDKMNKEGMTVFMSSHNLTEVEKTCSKIAIIKSGKIIATEKISALRRKKIFNIDVIFKHKIDPDKFTKTNMKILSSMNNQYIFQVKKDINSALKILSKYDIENIVITHASLEDIFLEYYGVKNNLANNEFNK